VLAVALQQLVDAEPLPPLLMRTVILTAQRFPSLVSSGFITSSLAHLIRHRVWLDARLWDGVVKCFKMLGSRSFSILLQLPEPQLADVLQRSPEVREDLKKYAAGGKNVPKALQKVLGVEEVRKKAPA